MSPRFDFDLLCIGSGPAGQRAAIQAAKLGKKVAIVERQRLIGGVCVDTGTIPSKTFREAVRRVYSRPGLDSADFNVPNARVRPTMAQLVTHVAKAVHREAVTVQETLSRNDVALIRGHAAFVDPHSVQVQDGSGGQRVSAERLLIAVGTSPSRPRGISPDGEVLLTADTVLDMPALPRSMVVVGAGVIGIEYASMFAALGVHVTVIDQRTRPLEFLDHEIVDELIHQLRKADVVFRSGDAVADVAVVAGAPSQALLRLDSGKHVVADVVLLSAGRVGATEELNLEAAGLSADDRGRLSVDERYCTSVPHIFAAGDVIGFPALAATSSEQGRLAARHMFAVEAASMGQHFPVGIYAIPEVSMVGATEEQLTRDKIPYESGVARYREISRGPILGDDSGMLKMLFHRDDHRLLGCHCIGSGATELIHVGQAVLALGGGLEFFLANVFNYPTLAECYKVAALNAANKLSLVHQVTRAIGPSATPESCTRVA
jgi:NAD(P) transhydrogenase